jgi:hypothetical protein
LSALINSEFNRRTLRRDIRVKVLREEDKTDATEEEVLEEAFTHTPEVQEGSGNVVMSSGDELGS